MRVPCGKCIFMASRKEPVHDFIKQVCFFQRIREISKTQQLSVSSQCLCTFLVSGSNSSESHCTIYGLPHLYTRSCHSLVTPLSSTCKLIGPFVWNVRDGDVKCKLLFLHSHFGPRLSIEGKPTFVSAFMIQVATCNCLVNVPSNKHVAKVAIGWNVLRTNLARRQRKWLLKQLLCQHIAKFMSS